MFSMSAQDQLTLDVIVKVSTGSISRLDGQRVLDVSERTIRRYLSEYKNKGVIFVKHGNCGRSPTNATSPELKEKIQALVKENYFDFNMSHCLEKLSANEGLHLKRETFRKWCHEINLVKKAKRRGAKVRKLRQRMKQTGLMIQMDGSPHRWFGNRESCLIAGIDDADSNVPWGEFFPAEDSISCLVVLQKIIERVGIFKILYVDRAGIFGGPKRAEFSQVKRALEELGIHVVFANSAEGKGRIERLWGTLQDRLIPEMRVRGITTYSGANSFLQDVYLPGEYAQKFKVVPECLQTAYQPVPSGVDLNEIFCLKYYRSVNKDHTYSYDGDIYLIESDLKYSIQNQKIEIRISLPSGSERSVKTRKA